MTPIAGRFVSAWVTKIQNTLFSGRGPEGSPSIKNQDKGYLMHKTHVSEMLYTIGLLMASQTATAGIFVSQFRYVVSTPKLIGLVMKASHAATMSSAEPYHDSITRTSQRILKR